MASSLSQLQALAVKDGTTAKQLTDASKQLYQTKIAPNIKNQSPEIQAATKLAWDKQAGSVIADKVKRESDNSFGGMQFNAAKSAAKDMGITVGQSFTSAVGGVADFLNDKINNGNKDTILGGVAERSAAATQQMQNAGSQTLQSGNDGALGYAVARGAIQSLPTLAIGGGIAGAVGKTVQLGRAGIAAARGAQLAAEAGKVAKATAFAGSAAGQYGLMYSPAKQQIIDDLGKVDPKTGLPKISDEALSQANPSYKTYYEASVQGGATPDAALTFARQKTIEEVAKGHADWIAALSAPIAALMPATQIIGKALGGGKLVSAVANKIGLGAEASLTNASARAALQTAARTGLAKYAPTLSMGGAKVMGAEGGEETAQKIIGNVGTAHAANQNGGTEGYTVENTLNGAGVAGITGALVGGGIHVAGGTHHQQTMAEINSMVNAHKANVTQAQDIQTRANELQTKANTNTITPQESLELASLPKQAEHVAKATVNSEHALRKLGINPDGKAMSKADNDAYQASLIPTNNEPDVTQDAPVEPPAQQDQAQSVAPTQEPAVTPTVTPSTQVEGLLADDIKSRRGNPYTSQKAAVDALERQGLTDTHDVVQLGEEAQYVLRKKAASDATLSVDAPESQTNIMAEWNKKTAETKKQEIADMQKKMQTSDDVKTESMTEGSINELPVDSIKLSKDVPQFKSGANGSGVVEPLGGKFDRTGVAPIQVWKRKDGSLEVISGRHRLDLARRSGEKTIPAQVHDENNGFTVKHAAVLDALLNIRDGQGKVKDYVDYFKESGTTKEQADKQGVLARSTGKRAFTLANAGSDELITAHRNDSISDQAAVEIAEAAPNSSPLQAIGIKALQDGKTNTQAVNLIHAIKSMNLDREQSGKGTDDLFGFDDSGLKEAEKMASYASKKQREIAEQLAAIKGASKRPELAAKHGVNVKDKAGLAKKVTELAQAQAKWANWSSHRDLIAQIRSETGLSDSFGLSAPTQAELDQKDRDVADAAAAEKAKQDRQKIIDDSQNDDFALQGGNTPKDYLEARGQKNLFDAPPAQDVTVDDPYKGRNEALKKPIADWDANDFSAAGMQAMPSNAAPMSSEQARQENAFAQKMVKKIVTDGIARGRSTEDITHQIHTTVYSNNFAMKQGGVDTLHQYIEDQKKLSNQQDKAQESNIKAITAKQIPNMTDAELQLAADHYGADHPRTVKLKKEMAKRDIGVKNTSTAPVETPAAHDFTKEKHKRLGKNKRGNSVFEDVNGVRSYIDSGVRVSETVGITPTRNGTTIDTSNRTDEHRTVEEISQNKPELTTTKPETKAEETKPSDYGSKNTLVSVDRAAELRKKLQAKLRNQLPSGIDPEILAMGAELAVFHIEAGVRKFTDFAKTMAADLDMPISNIKRYLRSWYNGARDMMEDAGLSIDGMDSPDVVRDELAKLPIHEAVEQKPAAKTLVDTFYQHLKDGSLPTNNVMLRKMVAEFDGKDVDNYRLKEAQEALEAAMARHAHDIVAKGKDDTATFNELLEAYKLQPNLNIRTSTSMENQAYSTPAPLAFIAARLAGIDKNTKVYEPTAGNGMLLLTASPKNATVNELEDTRYSHLKDQGFNAYQGDALNAIQDKVVKEESQDAMITNPPFGSVKNAQGEPIKVGVDGYKIGKIDHYIAADALRTIKDDGKATLIIGADKVAGGVSADDRIFFNWLYSHYNVTGHFEIDGKLYTRQGAGWSVRVITIDGRKASNKVSPMEGTIKRVNTWEQVYENYRQILDANNGRGSSKNDTRGNDAGRPSDAEELSGTATQEDQPPTQPAGSTGAGRTRQRNKGGSSNVSGTPARDLLDSGKSGSPRLVGSDSTERLDSGTNAQDQLAVGDNRDSGKPARSDKPSNAGGKSSELSGTTLADADNAFQVQYIPRSSRKDEGVLVPVNMRQPMQDGLSILEDNVGNIDEYAAKELGYDNVEQLHDALMGLQVDSVASAIYQIKEKNKGVIIADQTGIGKGRQAAAIIRWAHLNGHTPVFVTMKPALFTDMYGDLADIGTHDIKPLIFNTDGFIAGKGEEKLFKNKPAEHAKNFDRLMTMGELPSDRNAVFLTYSQINKPNKQQQALSSIAGNAVFILDESHNAGGSSGTGQFMQAVLQNAKGVVYLSATYAKRPDNMPLYFKTDMGSAISDNEGLMNAMEAGGLPLQTIVANALVKSGQMFRRERSYDGVSIETKIDSTNKAEHERLSDGVTSALRAIVNADKLFHKLYFKHVEDQAKKEGEQLKKSGNNASQSVNHAEFSSVVHNFVRQMLLGLKADKAATEAIESLKRNEKPIIALENTMGSFLNEYITANDLKIGDPLTGFDYRAVLSRALERSRYILRKDAKGNEEREYISLDKLDSITLRAYTNAQDIIDGLTLDIPVSPLDWIRSRIEKAGYSVAEITGRNMAVDYSGDVPRVHQLSSVEQKDKVTTTRRFNSGELDAVILNVSGSTGISLHASEKFKDQRQRHMIVAQPAQDINVFMQMLGRVHRTGQVVLPKYTMLNVDLPAEKRPTALLNKKMKSLNANTSSNTESATSIKAVDMLNKYGDQIVDAYLAENIEVQRALGIESGDQEAKESRVDLARTVTGRAALLPVAAQHALYNDIEPQYEALMSYLNETNQNDLEPKTVDYEAQALKEVQMVAPTDTSTPFGQEAVYGEYSIKPQGKAMTLDEINEAIKTNLGGYANSRAHEESLITAAKKQRTQNIENRSLDSEEYQSLTEDQKVEIRKELDDKDMSNPAFDAGMVFITNHGIGSMWRVEVRGDVYNGVITNLKVNHKGTGNPLSLSKIQVTLAVNGGLRSISLPATQFNKIAIANISHLSRAGVMAEKSTATDVAKIITGNLLAAYGNLKDGTRGSVISFTKKDGSTEQGILMPKSFDFANEARHDVILKDGSDMFKVLMQTKSKDIANIGISDRSQDIRIVKRDHVFTVVVPKSKAKGAKWYLNKELLAVTGDFVSHGGSHMRALIQFNDIARAKKALDIIAKITPIYAPSGIADEAREILGIPALTKKGDATDTKRYSKKTKQGGEPQTPKQVRDILVGRFGEALIAKLEKDGKLEIHDSHENDGVEGYNENGVNVLVAKNLTADSVIPTFLHEVGGHAGFQDTMKPETYQKIMDSFHDMVAAGNEIAIRAKKLVDTLYQDQATRDIEYIAHFITEATKAQDAKVGAVQAAKRLIDRVVAAVKAFAFDKLGVNLKLTPNDIVALAERMVNQVSKGDSNIVDSQIRAKETVATEQQSETKRVMVAKELERIISKSDDGTISTKEVGDLLATILAKKESKGEAIARKDLTRGHDWIIERLTRAKRLGELNPETVDMTLWFLEKNPSIADDLAVSLVGSKNAKNAQGTYNKVNRVVKFIKNNDTQPLVGVHEILHHSERMMPEDVRTGIIKEWVKSYVAARNTAVKNIDPKMYEHLRSIDSRGDALGLARALSKNQELRSAYRNLAALDAILEANNGDKSTLSRIMKSGRFPNELYQLFNPSEFWAVNGSEIMAGKFGNQSFVARATQWTKEFIEKIKHVFGLRSDAPVIRGLESVLKGDGSYKAGLMLHEKGLFKIAQQDSPVSDDRASDAWWNRQFKDFFAENNTVEEVEQAVSDNYLPSNQSDQTSTPAFKKWFGDSKVVDANGKPLVVYHGSPDLRFINEDGEFKSERGRYGMGRDTSAHWFAASEQTANSYADPRRSSDYQNAEEGVIATYLKLENPLIIDGKGQKWRDAQKSGKTTDVIKEARDNGHDGVIIKNVRDNYQTGVVGGDKSTDTYVVFNSNQIKSATDNNGTFDATNPDIRFSRRAPEQSDSDKQAAIKDMVDSAASVLSGLSYFAGDTKHGLGTGLNTMLQKAETHPEFKRVFNLVQKQIAHTAEEAYDSLRQAPELLGHMETGADLWRSIKAIAPTINPMRVYRERAILGNFKKITDDNKAAAEALFEGTLNDKVVYTDKELREQFELTPDQIEVYRKARNAIDTSLDNAAKAAVSRIAAINGVSWDVIHALHEKDLSLDKHFDTLSKMLDEDAKEEGAIDNMEEVVEQAHNLKEEGYAPLMRFGDFYVRTQKKEGKGGTTYRQHFETRRERDLFAKKLAKILPDDEKMEVGVINPKEHEQFKGMSPETVALFAKTSGLSNDAATQAYLKLAVSGHSALRRMIHREGIDGFDKDVQRVIAGFIMSNARRSSNILYSSAISSAVAGIKDLDGRTQQEAQDLINYVADPKEEIQWLKNIMFNYNLAGSIAFGLVNLTQPFTMTAPYLMQFAGAGQATGAVMRGMKIAAASIYKGEPPKAYEKEYLLAQKQGHIEAANVFMLQGMERGKSGVGSSYLRTITHVIGMNAQYSEMMNRRATLFAALDIARKMPAGKLKELGFDTPYDFAIKAIQVTQGIYNKGNRPKWARGNTGGILMMYKQFSINYVEMLYRMYKNPMYAGEKDNIRRAFWAAIAIIFSFSGALGLPFAGNVKDVTSAAISTVSDPVNIEREVQLAIGKPASDFLLHGGINMISPMDFKSRMSMGDLIPAVGYLDPNASENDKRREGLEIFGAVGGFANKMADAYNLAGQGELSAGLTTALPKFADSMGKGIDMATTGKYVNQKGQKISDVTLSEAAMKFLDIQPSRIAKEQRQLSVKRSDIAIQQQAKKQFRSRLVKATVKGDSERVSELWQELEDWNTNNEDYQIDITEKSISTAAEKAESTSSERLEKQTPKEMRGTMEAWEQENE